MQSVLVLFTTSLCIFFFTFIVFVCKIRTLFGRDEAQDPSPVAEGRPGETGEGEDEEAGEGSKGSQRSQALLPAVMEG